MGPRSSSSRGVAVRSDDVKPVKRRRAARAVTVLAAGLLLLDAVLLVLAGVWAGRPWLIVWGALFGAGGGGGRILRGRDPRRAAQLAGAPGGWRAEGGATARKPPGRRRRPRRRWPGASPTPSDPTPAPP